ncbi:hypothetical protein LguiB_026232 [Lonicera macranthoides]
MTETTRLVHLPDEIIDEILSRVPIKSLLRFKCVCRHWFSKISDPNFRHKREIESILQIKSETRTISLHSIDGDKVVTESFVLPSNDRKYECKRTFLSNSCNGLVIICFGKSFFLFNPSTRYLVKVLELNYLRYNCVVMIGLCYDASTKDYKVVIRFTHHSDDVKYVVAASLKTKRWVEINFPFEAASVNAGPMVNGKMHWTVNEKFKNSSLPQEIICFDQHTNLFKEFPSPQSKFRGENAIAGLGVLGECLCMVRRKFHTVEILIMKEYGVKESWTSLSTVTFFSSPFLFIKNGEILGKIKGYQVFAHNPQKNTRRKFDLTGSNDLLHAVALVQNVLSPVGYEWDEIRHANHGSNVKWLRYG